MFINAVPWPCKEDLDAQSTNELVQKFIKFNATRVPDEQRAFDDDSEVEHVEDLENPALVPIDMGDVDLKVIVDDFNESGFDDHGFAAIADGSLGFDAQAGTVNDDSKQRQAKAEKSNQEKQDKGVKGKQSKKGKKHKKHKKHKKLGEQKLAFLSSRKRKADGVRGD